MFNRKKKVTPTDTLYMFGVWLTTRAEPVTFSMKHDANVMVKLIDEFMLVNDLPDVSKHFPDNLKLPQDKEGEHWYGSETEILNKESIQ